MKLSKEDFNASLIKGLIAQFLFTIAYIFVYSLILGSSRPLSFIESNGFVHTYLVVALLVGAIPFVFCGYLIVLARNKNEDLEKKNAVLSISMFAISFVFYLIITILQLIFEYRNIYDFFILFNYPLLRATMYLELSKLQINMMMLLATFVPALCVYWGGKMRIKVLKKGA